jgi:cysteine-rich repeat protein
MEKSFGAKATALKEENMKGTVKWLLVICGVLIWASCTQLTNFDMPKEDAQEDDIVSDDGVHDPDGEEVEVPPNCGNGRVEAGEDCDDGNDTSGDGCEPDCTYSCTDSSECVDTNRCNGTETCNTSTHTCESGTPMDDGDVCLEDPRSICLSGVCVESTCGDGFVDTGAGEGCEPPNEGNCNADCHFTCTGDEDCNDDGNECNGEEYCNTTAHECQSRNPLADCAPCGTAGQLCVDNTCQDSSCGDECVDPEADPPEDCDDGNTDPDDGCENDCTFTCTEATQAADCDDTLPCTDDTCDDADHMCDHATSADTVVCRAAAGACDVAENCNGTDTTCPADAVVSSGTECRASAGACDIAEDCDGTAATCPADAFEPSTTVCRAAVHAVCDIAENCTGDSAACPTDGFAANTVSCSDLYCWGDEHCDGAGACVAGTTATCDLTCTSAETCDEGTDQCSFTVDTGCAIALTCYADGTANPANPCQWCDDTAPTVWTNNDAGTCTTCSSTPNCHCDAGACVND